MGMYMSFSCFIATEYKGKGYWIAFINMSKTSKSIKQLEKELKRLNVVLDVKIGKPFPVFLRRHTFSYTAWRLGAIIMLIELFSSLLGEIKKILIPLGFEAVFYNAGKKRGECIAEVLSQRVPQRPKVKDLAEVLRQATKAVAFFGGDFMEIEPKTSISKNRTEEMS
jgi:hypothetical protein